MDQLKNYEKIAENLAVAFKLASSAASLFGSDLDKVRESQKKADPTYIRQVPFTFKPAGLREWLKYKKAVYDSDINDLKMKQLVEQYLKNKN